jgi:hypothetical protein
VAVEVTWQSYNHNGFLPETFAMNDANTVSANIPAGFEQVKSAMDYPKLELKPGEEFIGTVVEKTTETFPKNGKDETVTYLLLQHDDELFRVGESASLSKFVNEAEKGQEVYIKFIGEEKTGKPSPMKRYITAIKR